MSGQCVILVGGLGTRLGDIAKSTPKPLLPVRGRPFLEYLLAKAARHGFDRILLLAGHRAEVLDDWLGDSGIAEELSLDIVINREPEPLGTAGALVHARPLLAETFLLLNGDTWFDFDWSALTLSDDTDGAVALRSVSPADRYETIELEGGLVAEILPRDPGLEEGLINGGVYRLRASALDGVRVPASLEADVLPRLARRDRLAGQVFDGVFIDIGVPDSYLAAEKLDLGGGRA